MKKTFPLHLPDTMDSRVITAIQITLNKYVKRERRKALPTEADHWNFQCRVGANRETAQPCQLAGIPAGIEAVALAEHPEVYVEIVAEPGQGHRRKPSVRDEAERSGV